MADLTEQPPPSESRCPACGGDPTADVTHRLSALGYTHDDIEYTCADCGRAWTCGVPIGAFDRPEMAGELWCDSCDSTAMLVHRVDVRGQNARGDVDLHLKCPNPECRYFTIVARETDSDGIALTGYASLAGATADAAPYGYPEVTNANNE